MTCEDCNVSNGTMISTVRPYVKFLTRILKLFENPYFRFQVWFELIPFYGDAAEKS